MQPIIQLVDLHFDLVSVCVAVAAMFLLGFIIFLSDRASMTNRAFFYLAVINVIWGVSNFLEYKFPTTTVTLWALRIHLFISCWYALLFFRFGYIFPERTLVFPKWYYRYLLPLLIFTAVLTLTPFVFTGISTLAAPGEVTNPSRGLGIILFALVAFGLLIAGAWSMYKKARKAASPNERRQRLSIFFGMSATAFLILTFNVLLPIFFNQLDFIPLAALFMLPFIALISYEIGEHGLFDLKVGSATALVFVLAIANLLEIASSTDTITIFLNIGTFVLVLIAGVILIRSVLREVQQREEIERLSQEKSEFMSFASHEIRNPITAMRGYASLLFDGTVAQVSEPVREVAQKILVNGDTVLSLISEFLNKSKLELGQVAYNIVDTDLGKNISSIGEGFKAHANEQGLTLEVKIDFPALMVRADEAKLREVVGNIIDNSIKYTKSGGVTIEVEKRNGMGRVIVSDTGVGIPPETISHLFQKFSRADAHKMNLLGTGLGLYLAKTFIEGMGGKIWAESDGPGKGSRFIIELHTV